MHLEHPKGPDRETSPAVWRITGMPLNVPARIGRFLAHAAVAAVALSLASIAGCSGGDPDPITAPPQPKAPVVTSGVFDVTSEVIFDTCNSQTAYDGAYDIEINGADFQMGTEWTGQWDKSTAEGKGASEIERVTVRFCTVTSWTEVTVTFSSPDEFGGVVIFRRRVDGDCSTPCQTSWKITGVRR